MTAQDLKNAILQLAVQGKLVPQDPNDEPASALLKQISAEKERLVKEGKIKKEKTLPEITEEDAPFDIPASWRWLRLGDFCAVYNGDSINATVKQEKYSKPCDGWDFIATKDVGFDHVINYQNGIWIPFQEADFKVAPAGSVLLCMEGGSAGKKIGILDRDVCFGNKLCCFRSITVHNTYLYYYLQCPRFFSDFMGSMTGLIGGVGAAKLKNIVISIPPLAEQKRIVAKIEELMPMVEEYGKAEERLTALNAEFPDKLRKSILQQAIQGKLTKRDPADQPASELLKRIRTEKERLIKEGKIKKEKPLPPITEEEMPFEIPDTWAWMRLSEMLLIQPTNGVSPKGVDYKTPFKNLTLTATTSGYFKPDSFKYVDISADIAERYYLKDEDILIQRSNSRELVGTSCIYRHGNDLYIYPDLIMRLHLMPEISVDYIDFVLKAPPCRSYYQESASGSSLSMPKINQSTVRNTVIPLPPLAEQQRIVDRVNELLAVCDELKRRNI